MPRRALHWVYVLRVVAARRGLHQPISWEAVGREVSWEESPESQSHHVRVRACHVWDQCSGHVRVIRGYAKYSKWSWWPVPSFVIGGRPAEPVDFILHLIKCETAEVRVCLVDFDGCSCWRPALLLSAFNPAFLCCLN